MVSVSGKDANLDDSKEREVISTSKVVYKDPQMVQISLYEIRNFLIAGTWAKFLMVVGSLLVGGVLSAVFSKISVPPWIVIGSLMVFIVGVFLDVYLTRAKLRELERKGIGKWK